MTLLRDLPDGQAISATDKMLVAQSIGGQYKDRKVAASAVASYINTAESDVYRPEAYGAVADGSTDCYTAIVAALAAMEAANGGVLQFSPGVYRINSQITLPNTGTTFRTQKAQIWRGAGSTACGADSAINNANGGTVLDMRYASTNAKLITLAFGQLEITGISFADLSSGGAVNSTPFILTTFTTLKIHHCAFFGNPSKGSGTCDQDAITLGGTSDTDALAGTNAVTSAFQGYGTTIEACYFNRIRRAVYGRTFANDCRIIGNFIGVNTGGGASSSAIEFSPGADNCSGNVISFNGFEMSGYAYGIKLTASLCNSIIGNSFYDSSGTTVADIRFNTTAVFNTVLQGLPSVATPISEHASVVGSNAIFGSNQSQKTVLQGLLGFATGQYSSDHVLTMNGTTVDAPAGLQYDHAQGRLGVGGFSQASGDVITAKGDFKGATPLRFGAGVRSGTDYASIVGQDLNDYALVGGEGGTILRYKTTFPNRIGFLDAAPVIRQVVTGDRADPATALKTVLAGLANLGLITDSSTGTETNPYAILNLTSTTKGLVLAKMTTTQANTLSTALTGGVYTDPMLIFDSTLGKLKIWNGSAFEVVTSA